MPTAAELLSRYRPVLPALVVSAALHAALLIGIPPRIESIDAGGSASYSATLVGAVAEGVPDASASAPAPAPRPRRVESKRVQSHLAPPPPIPDEALEPLSPLPPGSQIAAFAPDPVFAPEVVALSQPSAPVDAPEPFPLQGLPASVSIDYQLNSPFAEGRAVYTWNRDGNKYTITGEAEAVGFFTLFLEGRILQESSGTVTATGLRPERFTERKPNAAAEGLQFDWPARQVTMDRGDRKKTTPLIENTVDWLSMIFQLAHQPPKGNSMELSVFTQRKFYKFDLKVLGEEEIAIPLGKVRALHLRHVDARDPTEVVDVWLGIEQHYLPVKLRYPVARNRLVVEQIATKVTSR